eukprot:gene12995-7732_t
MTSYIFNEEENSCFDIEHYLVSPIDSEKDSYIDQQWTTLEDPKDIEICLKTEQQQQQHHHHHHQNTNHNQVYSSYQFQPQFPMQKLVVISSSKQFLIPQKIEKRKQQRKKNETKISIKKNYATDKIRSNLPKRCGDETCSYGQHYSLEVAEKKNKTFDTMADSSTYCPCGATIQYRIDNKWLRSGGLSKHLKKK